MSGLAGGTRLTVSLGEFTGANGSYTGQVAAIGNVGYTVSDIAAGMLLYSGAAIYEIQTVTVITAGVIVELGINYLSGSGSVEAAPATSIGQITLSTPNLGLPLFTQVGSAYLSPEQLAKLLSHAMLIIDGISAGGGAATISREVLDVTGAEVLVPALPENPSYIRVIRNYQELFSNEYAIPAGGGRIVPTVASDDESWKIEWRT